MILKWRGFGSNGFNGFVAGLTLCFVVLIANGLIAELRPGNVWGLSYGVAATVLVTGAALYSVRRRSPRKGPGPARHWLAFHIYGGSLFLLLVLMHTGFRFPEGSLAWAMWLLSFWLVLSGIFGVVLQKWIPRMLTSGLATEVLCDRIPELISVVGEKARALVATCDPSIRDFYERSLAESLENPQPRFIYYIDVTGGIQSRIRQFDYIRGFLPAEERTKLNELEGLYRTKLEMDAHYTLQKTLRWWLHGHVPVSAVLIVLVVFHIFSIAYY